MALLKEDFMQAVKDYLLKNNKSLALVGMMGVGKTEVGKILSVRLGFPLLEADEEIVRRAGKSIKEIFVQDGEPHFRALECAVTEEILDGQCILSCGGGAYAQDKTREVIDAGALAVWLYDDPKTVYERIKDNPVRPLVGLTFEDYDDLLAKREPLYAKAPIHVNCRGLGVEAAAEKVLSNCAQRFTL